jgi:hypothetical protein
MCERKEKNLEKQKRVRYLYKWVIYLYKWTRNFDMRLKYLYKISVKIAKETVLENKFIWGKN